MIVSPDRVNGVSTINGNNSSSSSKGKGLKNPGGLRVEPNLGLEDEHAALMLTLPVTPAGLRGGLKSDKKDSLMLVVNDDYTPGLKSGDSHSTPEDNDAIVDPIESPGANPAHFSQLQVPVSSWVFCLCRLFFFFVRFFCSYVEPP